MTKSSKSTIKKTQASSSTAKSTSTKSSQAPANKNQRNLYLAIIFGMLILVLGLLFYIIFRQDSASNNPPTNPDNIPSLNNHGNNQGGSSNNGSSNNPNSGSNDNQNNGTSITLDRAKEIALADAGLSTSQVTFTEQKTDYENGVLVYELEFLTNSTKYSYEIRQSDGSIYSKSHEMLHGSNNTQNNANRISLEDAKNKALADANLSSSQVTFTKSELDFDDGILVYELEFYSSSHKYEYEINANTGTIISKDIEALRR